MPAVVTMCVGDSITMGSPGYRGSWRRHLNNLAPNLAMVGRNCIDPIYGNTVGHHEGYSGATVSTFSSIAFADAYAPSLVIYNLGTNQIQIGETAAVALANVRAKAEEFAAKSYVRHVIVGNAPPRPIGYTGYAESVLYREGFVAAMAGTSAKITICDPWALAVNPGPHFADSLHPTEVGYLLPVPVIYATILSLGIQTEPDVSPRMPRPATAGYG